MHEMWHFEEDGEGWRWVHTDLASGTIARSEDPFRSRSACMEDALVHGYMGSRKTFGPARTRTIH